MAAGDLSFRKGTPGDLADTFALAESAIHDTAARQGIADSTREPTDAEIHAHWVERRALIEFTAAQPGGCYWLCEDAEGPVGFVRSVRFGAMEQLTELMVRPDRQERGIGRELMARCWPGDPTPELGRVVIAAGSPRDLSLYAGFGVMPSAGHWHLRERTADYLERRSKEVDRTEPPIHVLAPPRAVAEWVALEPSAIAYQRPLLHEFFGRDRTCLAWMDDSSDRALALCWVSSTGDIGPGVAARPADLVPVVLAALDRVAMTQEPEHLSVFATSMAWWLLNRLRGLGFRVYWPSWVMSSVPLPGLDRYLPTRPPHLI